MAKCNIAFLRSLASELNDSFRDYSQTNKEDLLRILTRKLSLRQVEDAVRLYLLCVDAEKIAKKIKEDSVKEISEAVRKHFQCQEFLYEVSVGNRICDIVFISHHNVVAVEVKSSRDKVARSVNQTVYYSQWADRVHLAYDSKHKRIVQNLKSLPHEIGLLEYNERRIEEIRDATSYPIEPFNRLRYMTHRFLRKTARKFQVSDRGTKKSISKKLSEKMSEEQVFQFFTGFLRSRSAYQGKVAKPFVENDRTYPLMQFSKEP